MEEETRYRHSWRTSRRAHPEPLYIQDDAARALDRLRAVSEEERHDVTAYVGLRLVPAGHILGATCVRQSVDVQIIHFTGDLGRSDDPLMCAPHPLETCDVPVTESACANRSHPKADPETVLDPLAPGELAKVYSIATAVHSGKYSSSPSRIRSRRRNAIVLSGFPAGGTRGAALMDGLRTVPSPPREAFVTHGEPAAADILRGRIVHELGWNARVPEHTETVVLG